MTKSQRFKPIQKISEKKERDAAATFGRHLKDREVAEKRLLELEQYLAEYQERFTQATRAGIAAARVQEYQAFIHKLEQAVNEQRRVIDGIQHQCDDSRAEWHGKLTKARAVDNAVDRMRADERENQARKEQSASDERSQRRRD